MYPLLQSNVPPPYNQTEEGLTFDCRTYTTNTTEISTEITYNNSVPKYGKEVKSKKNVVVENSPANEIFFKNLEEKENKIAEIQSIIVNFKSFYNGNLDKARVQEMVGSKGIDFINKSLNEYNQYIQGRKIRNIAADFYTFVMKGYEKPIEVNNMPKPSYVNFDQREYSEEDYEKYYANLNNDDN